MKSLAVLYSAALLLAFEVARAAEEPRPLLGQVLKSKRVVFLGDSVTHSGGYVELLVTYLRLWHPDSTVEIINLGLPSETVSGLSEPGHAGGAFPRPNLHERLDRVLEKAKPDLIFACYGMNDGIYHPFSEGRFVAFQSGIQRLRQKAGAAGAKIVHLTPPTFDPVPLKGRTLGPGLEEYRQPFEGYNEVLARYSKWLIDQRTNGWQIIDIHSPMDRFLSAERSSDSKFLLASDGVHANAQGHWLIAREILDELEAPEEITTAEDSRAFLASSLRAADVHKLIQQRQRLLKDAWLSHVGHLRPGMAHGKPLAEAQAEAAGLSRKIDSLLGVRGPVNENGRPLIQKLGTVDLDLVEATPIVLNDRLWRFEWVRQGIGQQYWDNNRATNYFRFRDPETGEVTPPFAEGHEFGSAFVHDNAVYVTGTLTRNRINMFSSRDLTNWQTWPVLAERRYGIFNTSICRTDHDFVLMFEIDRPAEEAGAPFTARFLRSPDLRYWNVTPPECNYAKDRYTAPHALRWSDGWFYNFYLEAHQGYEMRVVRSRDLVQWEPSPLNPVLRHSPEDKMIANPNLSEEQRTRIERAVNLNNSDLDFCEWQGRLIMTYSWGNQQGVEHLATAVYEGTLEQFLRGWFPESPVTSAP